MLTPEKNYKYCPECGAEYDSAQENCADCMITLVDSKTFKELKQKKNKEKIEQFHVVFMSRNKESAEAAHEMLNQSGIEAKLEQIDLLDSGLSFSHKKVFQVTVNSTDKEKSNFLLQEQGLATCPICSAAEEIDAALLERFKKTVEAGHSAFPELLQFLYENRALRVETIEIITKSGEEDEELLARKVVEICRSGNPLEGKELEIIKDIGEISGEYGETTAIVDEIAKLLKNLKLQFVKT
ncbi:MAG: hypothetical protein ABIH42_04225 [Planctomycetota bacterium]